MTSTPPTAPPIGDHDTTGEPIVAAEMGHAEPADIATAEGEADDEQTPLDETLTEDLSVQGGE